MLCRRLRSVISHHLLSLLLCCCACVRCVARLPRAAKKYYTVHLWQYGQIVTNARFWIFDGVSSSLAESTSTYFFRLFSPTFCSSFFSYYVRNPDTTDNTDITRAVQGACYNQLATTLNTPAACQRSRKQHTRAVVCPRCITALASCFMCCSCYRTL